MELLADQPWDPAAFRLTGRRAGASPLPTDPLLLSWVIASTLMVELSHQQRLLEQGSVSSRLRLEIELLKREATLLDLELANRLQVVPAYDRN